MVVRLLDFKGWECIVMCWNVDIWLFWFFVDIWLLILFFGDVCDDVSKVCYYGYGCVGKYWFVEKIVIFFYWKLNLKNLLVFLYLEIWLLKNFDDVIEDIYFIVNFFLKWMKYLILIFYIGLCCLLVDIGIKLLKDI